MSVGTELEVGGRWCSLRLDGREWLWKRADPARREARPGDPFVDAGGLEECLPTIRGVPDHGSVWSRPWSDLGDGWGTVATEDFRLERHLAGDGTAVRASYRLRAAPGYRFLWAAHALLELSTSARVEFAEGTPVRLYREASPYVSTTWPDCDGVDVGRLGEIDGTATGAVVVGADRAVVHDAADALELRLVAPGLPTSVAVWRNLGGFPEDEPYRSIGIEPMLGAVFDLADADGDDDAVSVPASGLVTWELQLVGRPARGCGEEVPTPC